MPCIAALSQCSKPSITARLAEQVERLAHHALQGEVWDKALVYSRQAGDKAMARSAYREAVACFEQALTALRHLPEQRHTQEQAIDLRYDLGNALQALGEFDRSFASLREAETLAEALGDQRRLGQICTNMTHSFWTMGDHDNALTCSQRALTLAAATGDAFQQARVHGYLGTIYFYLGDYHRAIDVLRKAIQSYEGDVAPCTLPQHDDYLRARPSLVAGSAMQNWGRLPRASPTARRRPGLPKRLVTSPARS